VEDPAGPRRFETTQWSLVAAASPGTAGGDRAREALERLCRAYWYPLYAFVRARGHGSADAQDLTQAFFARLLETDGLAGVDRRRGRFRSYLLGAMKHFLANEWHRERTQKRGGRVQFLEWDALDPESRYAGARGETDDPDARFDLEWALAIVSTALRTLREEMSRSGKSEQVDALEGFLTGELPAARDEIAARLGLRPEALKVAVHRLRRRYRELLRSAVADTVRGPSSLEEEMRYLLEVLRRR
jgi:RNA polymerase sigma-70 factor (ECF subfamily)